MTNSKMTRGESKEEKRNKGNRVVYKVVNGVAPSGERIRRVKSLGGLRFMSISKDCVEKQPEGMSVKEKKNNLKEEIKKARQQLPQNYKTLSLGDLMRVSDDITANSKQKSNQNEDKILNNINRVIVLENRIKYPPTKETIAVLEKLRLNTK